MGYKIQSNKSSQSEVAEVAKVYTPSLWGGLEKHSSNETAYGVGRGWIRG